MRSRILAHRGYWLEPGEKNSLSAFRRAFEGGFGIETDIRDLDGELVVSHDPPMSRNAPMPFPAFLDLYRSMKADGWLALNIKADGLAQAVAAQLAEYGVANAFVRRLHDQLRVDPGAPLQDRSFFGSVTTLRPQALGEAGMRRILDELSLDAATDGDAEDHLVILRGGADGAGVMLCHGVPHFRPSRIRSTASVVRFSW